MIIETIKRTKIDADSEFIKLGKMKKLIEIKPANIWVKVNFYNYSITKDRKTMKYLPKALSEKIELWKCEWYSAIYSEIENLLKDKRFQIYDWKLDYFYEYPDQLENTLYVNVVIKLVTKKGYINDLKRFAKQFNYDFINLNKNSELKTWKMYAEFKK